VGDSALPTLERMKAATQSEFLNYIHNFRAVAILFIVAGHCLDAFNWPQHERLLSLLSFFYKNGTLLFVFISGFLFQHLSARFSYRKYLLTKFKYIILPYIIVSIPAIDVFTFFIHRSNLGESFYVHSIAWQIATFLLTGSHVTAFWFIPMISIYYLASPLLIRLDAIPRGYFIIPVLVAISILVPRGETVDVNFVHFFSVYVIGMWFSRNKNVFIPCLGNHIWTLVALYGATVAIHAINMSSSAHLPGLNYFSKLILCLLLLAVLFRYDKLIGKKGDFLASISFGIFFIHSYSIQAIRYLTSGSPMSTVPWDGSVISHLILFTIIVSASSFQIVLVKKIFGKYSRNVVGC
jgi:surface polysaccharide O-acyltransferase-like enzyme